ncbi:hypothetical protein CEXT_117361 [Caerostris extrusa]|uniref:Uncharacterized protein n=1 Tax=Caerostris extrusa TaxID=172846 RepID=A0AAV4XEG8_CAEEX|nr:hypothetical protein CEXT_117361 [Caerostris extrusa]
MEPSEVDNEQRSHRNGRTLTRKTVGDESKQRVPLLELRQRFNGNSIDSVINKGHDLPIVDSVLHPSRTSLTFLVKDLIASQKLPGKSKTSPGYIVWDPICGRCVSYMKAPSNNTHAYYVQYVNVLETRYCASKDIFAQ